VGEGAHNGYLSIISGPYGPPGGQGTEISVPPYLQGPWGPWTMDHGP